MDSLIWAKMRFCPYWPAKLVETPPELRPTPRNKVCVLFLGTKQFGFVAHDKIESYIENREKFIKKGKGVDFHTAVAHMDEYISNKKKFRAHVFVKPKGKYIKIKTEKDVQKQLGIKMERRVSGDSDATNTVQTPATWAQEKESLIDNVMALKTENQTLVQNLNDKENQLNSANLLKHELEALLKKNESEYSTKLNAMKTDSRNAVEKNTQNISDLKKANALLVSQNKQLKTCSAQTERQNDSDDTEFYEVECLLDDKLVTETHYLVRWKGFTSSSDSWERESNLMCKSILKKYKQSKKM